MAHPLDPKPYPSADELRSVFDYDPATGIVVWKHRPDKDNAWNAHFAGKEAGCATANGYKQVRLNGRGLRYHRVAWILHFWECPGDMFIDHKNRDRRDNRIANLRLATRSDNCRNRCRVDGLPLPKGVRFHVRGQHFSAVIRPGDGTRKYLGIFNTPEAAHEAYCAAARKFHGEFASFG